MENAKDVLNDLVCLGIEPDGLKIFRTYLDRQTLKILYVPRPGLKLMDIAKHQPKLAAEPERYAQVPEYSTRMTYEAMLSFAKNQEVAVRDEILNQLSLLGPCPQFVDKAIKDEGLLTKWRAYLNQERVDFVKDWAKQNNISAFEN